MKKALRTGALITAGSVLFSFLPVWLWLQLDPVIDTASIYLSCIVLPLLIAPTCSFFVLRAQLRAEELARENHRLANVDDLTGLPNRRAYFAAAERLLQQARSGEGRYFCAIADIDDFKRVNDTHGHEVGDRVLIEVSTAMQLVAPQQGLIARLGGEEFALAGIFKDEEEARETCLALVRAVASLPAMHEEITISLGFAGDTAAESVSLLLSRSDEALYWAKLSGKNRVVSFPVNLPAMKQMDLVS